MPQIKDILAKVWLRRGTTGILSRRLCGGAITRILPTDQPQVNNRQADALIRNDQGALQHVEFQSTNDSDFPFRMLEYWVYFRRQYMEDVNQCVFYIGNDPLRLPSTFTARRTQHSYEIVNLQDYDSNDLLASPDWGDNLWSLGARGERPMILRELLARLSGIANAAERAACLAELTAFSGILRIDRLLVQKMKEFPVLDMDFKDNAVIQHYTREAEALGRQTGLEEGLREGAQLQLLDLLNEKFGPLPASTADRVHAASLDQIKLWARRILRANSIEETLSER